MVNDEDKIDEMLVLTDSIEVRLKASTQIQINAYDFTISRVPAALRKDKEVFYEPNIVSIGPYHRGNVKYEAMEELKWRQLQDFVNRNPNIGIDTYLTELSKLESESRRCYFEDIKLSRKEFVEMMLLDGCFILEFFHKYCYKNPSQFCAPISYNSSIFRQVRIDLLLLENQIPFFILQCLYDLNTEMKDNPLLLELAGTCFHSFYRIPGSDYNEEYYVNECRKKEKAYDHLLHLYHCFNLSTKEPQLTKPNSNRSLFALIKIKLPKWLNPSMLVSQCQLPKQLHNSFSHLRPKKKEKKVEVRKWRATVPCATKLVEAGITFKKRSLINFLDVRFKDGSLEIPCIYISSRARSLLMNLIAFEHCNHPADEKIVSFYVAFMDSIINTAKDVEILQQSKIIESRLNSDEETADLFNQLNKDVTIKFRHSYLLQVIEEINEYCETSWHKWRANLMRDYFSNPWAILSLVAAIILLILTFLQTFFAIYSYFKSAN